MYKQILGFSDRSRQPVIARPRSSFLRLSGFANLLIQERIYHIQLQMFTASYCDALVKKRLTALDKIFANVFL